MNLAGESQKGAESCDRLAHNQILHLVSAFVGVKSFSIREETANVVLGSNAVATQQLACPGHSLAALGRGECLGKRGASIRQLAFGFELSRADHHALRSGDVRQHFREEVLDELKRADGLAELQTLLAILERILVGAHRAAGCFPPNEVTGTLLYLRRIARSSVPPKAVLPRHPPILSRDQAVLKDFE